MKHHIATWPATLPLTCNLAATSKEEMLPFSIQTLKDMKQGNGSSYCADLFTILWVKQGSGTYIADLNRSQIDNNTVYYIKPVQAFMFDVDEDTDGYAISFSLNFLCMHLDATNKLSDSGLFNSFLRTIEIPLDERADIHMSMLAEKMMQEFYAIQTGNEMLPELLKMFLLYLNRCFEQSNRQYNHHGNVILVKKFFNLLEQNFISQKMVAHYASELAVTPNYLNEIIKKVTGFSARHHIQQRVVLEAKRKAVYAELSMKEVAYKLGFEDSYHFSKYFKNVSGVNFTTFKKGMVSHFGFM